MWYLSKFCISWFNLTLNHSNKIILFLHRQFHIIFLLVVFFFYSSRNNGVKIRRRDLYREKNYNSFSILKKMETNHVTILLIPRWIAIFKERKKGIEIFLLEELHSNWLLYYQILNSLQDLLRFITVYTNNIFYDDEMLEIIILNNNLIYLLINKKISRWRSTKIRLKILLRPFHVSWSSSYLGCYTFI